MSSMRSRTGLSDGLQCVRRVWDNQGNERVIDAEHDERVEGVVTMSQPWQRWQDWATVVIGVLLFVSPFVFGATGMQMAAQTAYLGGVLLVIAGVWSLWTPSLQLTEWAEVVIGVLVFLAPFVLGFNGLTSMAYSAWIGGVLAVILGGWVLMGERNSQRLPSRMH
jgi:VIT1/CCC1 family predicted Fe2+/Mn2+ transporter